MTIRGEAEFQLGQFTALLTLLEGRMDLNAEELCLVGRAELRFARYDAAELHLLRAALLGAQHASVEYAEVLFETGRTDEAAGERRGPPPVDLDDNQRDAMPAC